MTINTDSAIVSRLIAVSNKAALIDKELFDIATDVLKKHILSGEVEVSDGVSSSLDTVSNLLDTAMSNVEYIRRKVL